MRDDSRDSRTLVIVLAIAAVGGGAFYLWRQQTPPEAPPVVVVPKVEAPAARPDASPEPAVRHPVEPIERARARLPPLDESDALFGETLGDLFGKKTLGSPFRVEDFARHFVATVDNLEGPNAASHMWPVMPTEGRFVTDAEDAAIASRNAERYAPFVRLAESADAGRVVQAYRRLYPLFQKAYEELGSPDKYFNDRVVEVIDHLLATPTVNEPIPVKRVQVPGGSDATALYLFADPALERASAGHKILLRMGSDNAARVKAKLAEARRLLVMREPARP
jgi:hypothetical protein